jgi:hypothetical protein
MTKKANIGDDKDKIEVIYLHRQTTTQTFGTPLPHFSFIQLLKKHN